MEYSSKIGKEIRSLLLDFNETNVCCKLCAWHGRLLYHHALRKKEGHGLRRPPDFEVEF